MLSREQTVFIYAPPDRAQTWAGSGCAAPNDLPRSALGKPALLGILHTEALVADRSMSALVREWLEERLDLPAAEGAV